MRLIIAALEQTQPHVQQEWAGKGVLRLLIPRQLGQPIEGCSISFMIVWLHRFHDVVKVVGHDTGDEALGFLLR